jgi:hypothetical protein
MSEQTPPAPTMETYTLGDRTLAEWHKWLTTDPRAGEDTGGLAAPGSRYGRTSRECGYFAIAAQVVYAHANGIESQEDLEASLDWLMGLAINSHEDIGILVREWDWVLPEDLREQLDLDGGES